MDMTDNSPTEQVKGLFGLLGIWVAWLFGHIDLIKEVANVVASCAATIASVVYAWYYIKKIMKEK